MRCSQSMRRVQNRRVLCSEKLAPNRAMMLASSGQRHQNDWVFAARAAQSPSIVTAFGKKKLVRVTMDASAIASSLNTASNFLPQGPNNSIMSWHFLCELVHLLVFGPKSKNER